MRFLTPRRKARKRLGVTTTISAAVLSVPHQFQGPEFQLFIDDPAYRQLLTDMIQKGTDFVFEEAAGFRPSFAEKLAESLIGAGHYLDIDLPRAERTKYGLAEATGGSDYIEPFADSYRWELVDEHRKREELWLKRILEKAFTNGLVICGIGHSLSMCFRLQQAGVNIPKVYDYSPFDKLCRREHL